MTLAVVQLLRLIHILLGAFWVGTILFMVLFLLPSLRNVGPAAGQVMEQLTIVRRLPVYMMFIPMLTVLSGVALYWNASSGFSSQWMKSGPGATFAVGGILAIIVSILGATVNAPSGKRLGALGAIIRLRGGIPTPEEATEIQRIQGRLNTAMKTAAVLLLLALAAMSVARYMPS